jgi:Inner membrane component of T3SS, cytoplasmic domain
MIWVEVLSRHRDVTARFRINARELSIGRSYDNDVILDDPYVAARHLRVFHDEAGQLMAEDLGSANGMYLDRGRSRLARVAIDGNVPIRVGHTLIRIRETSHAVEGERLVRSASRFVQIAAAVVLGLALLALAAINVWFTQTSEPHLSDYLIPLLTLVGVGLIWIGMWSLLSRLFSGQSHFLRHVVIAESVALAFWTYNEVTQFLAFSLTWSIAYTYTYIASWLALAVMCFLHLREVGRTHLVAKGVVVAVLLVIAVAVQTLQRSEAYANSGRRTVWHVLLPPGLRMAPLQDETTFFADVGKLRTKLDADRAAARPGANVP